MFVVIRSFFAYVLHNVHILFVIIAIPAVVLFLSVLPPAWGLDEQVHTARSYQVSSGHWYPDKLAGEGRFGGDIPVSLERALTHGHVTSNAVNRGASFLDRKDDPNPALTQSINSKAITGPLVTYDFGPTGPYSPVPYLPSAAGIGLGRIFDFSVGDTLLFARLFQALFLIAIVAFTLWLLRASRIKWLVFTVALLPSVVYQAVTINADAYTIAASLLFTAVIYRLFTSKATINRRWLYLLGLSSLALVFTKPSYVLLLALVPFIPRARFGSKKRSLVWKTAVLLLAFLLLLITSIKGLSYGDSILLYRDAATAASISLTDQIIYILTHPVEFLKVLLVSMVRFAENWSSSVIGLLGYNTISTPYPFMVIAYISMFFAALYSKLITKKIAWLILGVTLVASLSIIVLLYGTFNSVGAHLVEGVQGRYFIPLLPLMLIAIGRLLPFEVKSSDKAVALTHSLVSVAVLYATCTAYIIAVI